MLLILIAFGIPLGILAAIIWRKRRISLMAVMLLVALTAALLGLIRVMGQ